MTKPIQTSMGDKSGRSNISRIILRDAIIIGCAIMAGIICWWIWKRNVNVGPTQEEAAEIFKIAKQQVALANYDSALNLYSSVAFAPIDEASIEQRQRQGAAFNNIGYVMFYCKQDQLNSYPYFLKALRISMESDYKPLLPYIWLNIANIKVDINRLEAFEAFRDAFKAAIEIDDREIANIAYCNLLNLAISDRRLDDISDEMDKFSKLSPVDTVELTEFAHLTHRGVVAMKKNDFKEAARLFLLSGDSIKVMLTPGRYQLQSLCNAATALVEDGSNADAINTLHKLEEVAIRESTPEVRCEAYKILDSIYSEEGSAGLAMLYKLRHLELSDSLYNFKHGYALKNVESRSEMDVMNSRYEQLGRRHDRIRIITLAVFIGLIGMLVFAIITFLQKRKSEMLLRSLYLKHRKLLEIETNSSDSSAVTASTVDGPTLQPVDEIATTPEEDLEKTKYKGSSLTVVERKKYADRISEIAMTSPDIYNLGFSLEKLAEMAGMREKIVSQVINETWNMNFNAWLNTYRCREAALRLSDPKYASMTIEAIAEGLGFRNRSHFAAVFKTSTGLTPAEYRRASKMT